MTTRFHFLVFLVKVLNNQDRCSDGSEYLEKDDRSGNNDEVGMMHLNVDQDLISKECFLKVEDEEDGDAMTTLHPILSIKNNVCKANCFIRKQSKHIRTFFHLKVVVRTKI